MPLGKAAGERCAQLDDLNRCRLFGHPERPKVCADFRAEPDICGVDRNEALLTLLHLEESTLREKAK